MTCHFSSFPISIVGNISYMNVLTIIVTRHGLSSVPGERKSAVLDKLKNKSRLHPKGTEFELRLRPVSFYLASRWDSTVGLEFYSPPRKGNRTATSVFPVSPGNPQTLSTPVLFSPVTGLLPVMAWQERDEKQKERQLQLITMLKASKGNSNLSGKKIGQN